MDTITKDYNVRFIIFGLSFYTVMIYLFISMFVLLEGYKDKGNEQYNQYECQKHDRVTTYIFPAYKLGCWLGEEVKENK